MFIYDAENRQITATGSGLTTNYVYDGNGKRVKSHNAVTGQTTVFVYDAEGKLSAENTIDIPAPTNPTISYLTEDALGSVRVTTNSFGEIKARRDFLPFGEELYAGLAGRNTGQKYSSSTDDTRKKFATYQRDAETGLDYAQSRYYSPMHGRFTSPDEFKGGPDELFDFEDDASDNPTFYADLTNPQSLNKYQYTYNNPYKYNDPSGHCPVCLLGGSSTSLIPRPVFQIATQAAKPTVETTVPRPLTGTFDFIPTFPLPSSQLFRQSAPKRQPASASQPTEGGGKASFRTPPKRNAGKNYPSRKRAKDASSTGRNRPKPQPPKNKPEKRRNWEDARRNDKPENHPNNPNSRYRRKHFHDRRKKENKKSDKPGGGTNNHNYFPKRF